MNRKPAVYAGIVVAAAAARLIPHAPNFTPIGALALFAGAGFEQGLMAFGLPLAAMLLSDAWIGFHQTMPSVYLSFLLTVLIGRVLRRRDGEPGPLRIAAASLASSVLFYLVTNFSVWLGSGMYPHSVAGLISCYAMAIPFFGNTIASGLFYCALLFGAARITERALLKPAF